MHQATNILSAIKTALTGLGTTGVNVYQTRAYPINPTPALSIRLSSIDPVRQISNAFLDSFVDVDVLIHVSGSSETLDAEILQIDAEVYAALMADRTLGGVAIELDPQTLTVESSAETEEPTALGLRRWRVHMRHSITSAEA